MIAFATRIVFVEKSLVSFFVNMYILCIYILGWGDIMYSKEYLENKINQSKGVDYMSTVIVQKWGNSLGIRIPKDAADKIGIKQGSEIELNVIGNEGIITLKPKRTRKKYTLEELISQITPENRHEEIDFGIEGRELI